MTQGPLSNVELDPWTICLYRPTQKVSTDVSTEGRVFEKGYTGTLRRITLSSRYREGELGLLWKH